VLRFSPIPESWAPWLPRNCLRELGGYDEAIAGYKHSIALDAKV
jgi:hypothetical protein